jgi:hypothetical protein
MKQMLKLPAVIVLAMIVSISLRAQEAVAWIVEGHENCIIQRMVMGSLKKFNAEHKMKLYPGDKLLKPGKIDSIRMDFRPYAKAIKKNNDSLVIEFNPPDRTNKENFLKKIGEFLGLVKVNFYESAGGSRGMDFVDFPEENATVIPGEKITFSRRFIGNEIVFKDLPGKEISREKIEENRLYLTPEEIGLIPSEIYIWEIVKEFKVLHRAAMKFLSQKDGDLIEKDLRQIDSEKISTDEKRLKKAAYLQMMSDLYPTEINLYWLSYQFLIEIGNQDKAVKDLANTLQD